ncbi:MAG TPA: ATP-binding protein [Bacillota bacterium]|nr:ATP-binding protein [Bacillota bacterium]
MSIKYSDKRISIIIGGYGSGKTEVAMALARHKRQTYDPGVKVSLVDLDIVNPYFRSRDKAEMLESEGIHLIAPEGALRQADLPALPAAIGGAILNPEEQLVIDVGGDPAGATALGRYAPDLIKQGYDLLMVINPYRPHTGTPEALLDLLQRIESVSRLKVTGLVNNGNVMEYTGLAELLRGQDITSQVSEISRVPIRFAASSAALVKEARETLPVPVLELAATMHPPW